jgi:hypothetical protein
MIYYRNRPQGPAVYSHLYATAGDERNEELCDAFLQLSGYVLIEDVLHELLYATRRPNEEGEDCFCWVVRLVTMKGQA